MKFIAGVAVLLLTMPSCIVKPKTEAQTKQESRQTQQTFNPNGDSKITSREQFIAYSKKMGDSFVLKYAYSTNPTFPFLSFQNINTFEFHAEYLASETEHYKRILVNDKIPFESLIYREQNGKTNPKELTIGRVAINDTIKLPDSTETGVIAFTTAVGDSFGPQEVEEIKAIRDVLKENVKVGLSTYAYVFEQSQSFFTHGKKVRELGIPVLLSARVWGNQ